MAGVDVIGVAGVLHDLERVAHRLDLDAGRGVLERERERAQVAAVAELDAHEPVGDALRRVGRRLVVEAAAELAHRVVHAFALALPVVRAVRQAQPHDQAAVVVGPVEGEAGGVRAAVAHGRHMRTSDEPTGALLLQLDAGDPAHQATSSLERRHQPRRGLVRLGDVDADELARALRASRAPKASTITRCCSWVARAAPAPPGRSG